MNSKTPTTAVVIIPPEGVWPSIQAIRARHDRQVRRWMPHLTLLYPFLPKEELAVWADRFAPVCRGLGPFSVELARFGHFSHGADRFTLWLEPQPGEQLVRLQRLLEETVPECDDLSRFPGGFTPHLSVGQASSRRVLEEELRSLQTDWTPLTFVIEEISLIWRGAPPDDVFRVGRKVRLGTQEPARPGAKGP